MFSKMKILASIIILSSLVFFSGCVSKNTTYNLNLEVWGVFDNSEVFSSIFSQYKEKNPFIREIKYRKFNDEKVYKKDLLDALASGQGPDIFYIRNTWLPSFKNKIEPAPNWILGEQEFRRDFADVAVNDFLDEGKIYALPLIVDSLALYYNKDLFNFEGITYPPATWEELLANVRKLTKINSSGNITQQGIAIGTAENVNRSTDILCLLMMQKGAQMVNKEKTGATLSKPVITGGNAVPAGEKALEFYTQFANSGSPYYSWGPGSRGLHYSIDAFFEGTAAMMINYSRHYETIKSKNSKLNFAVSRIPQFAGSQPANYADYWGLAVAKNKNINSPDARTRANNEPAPDNKVRVHESWQLIKFLTMKNSGKITLMNGISGTTKDFPVDIDPAAEYLKKTGQPAARRDIIDQQKSDPVLGPFAYGNLIAKSWYQAEPEENEAILADTINSVNNGTMTIHQALKLADSRITQFMRR